MKLGKVLVCHAYLLQQLQLDPAREHGNEPRVANYLYALYWEDWVHPTSILDHILVLHHEVDEATRNRRHHRDLMESGTFYLWATYVLATIGQLYGELEAIPLLELDDLEWLVPDMHTTKAFRSKLATDFGVAMKASFGNKVAHC